jgi:hypothetical protein
MASYEPWNDRLFERAESSKYVNMLFNEASDSKVPRTTRLNNFTCELKGLLYTAHCAKIGSIGANDIIDGTMRMIATSNSKLNLWEIYKLGVINLHRSIGNIGYQQTLVDMNVTEELALEERNRYMKAKLTQLNKQINKHISNMSKNYIDLCNNYSTHLLNEHTDLFRTFNTAAIYIDMQHTKATLLIDEHAAWIENMITQFKVTKPYRGRTNVRSITTCRMWYSTSPSNRSC